MPKRSPDLQRWCRRSLVIEYKQTEAHANIIETIRSRWRNGKFPTSPEPAIIRRLRCQMPDGTVASCHHLGVCQAGKRKYLDKAGREQLTAEAGFHKNEQKSGLRIPTQQEIPACWALSQLPYIRSELKIRPVSRRTECYVDSAPLSLPIGADLVFVWLRPVT